LGSLKGAERSATDLAKETGEDLEEKAE